MERAEWESQLNHTGELWEQPEDELQQALEKYHKQEAALKAVRRSNEHTRAFLRSMGWPVGGADGK